MESLSGLAMLVTMHRQVGHSISKNLFLQEKHIVKNLIKDLLYISGAWGGGNSNHKIDKV